MFIAMETARTADKTAKPAPTLAKLAPFLASSAMDLRKLKKSSRARETTRLMKISW